MKKPTRAAKAAEAEAPEDAPKPKRLRGFAAISPERQREIAAKGGRAAHLAGTAHEWTGGKRGTARAAGKKGGKASQGGKGKNWKPPETSEE